MKICTLRSVVKCIESMRLGEIKIFCLYTCLPVFLCSAYVSFATRIFEVFFSPTYRSEKGGSTLTCGHSSECVPAKIANVRWELASEISLESINIYLGEIPLKHLTDAQARNFHGYKQTWHSEMQSECTCRKGLDMEQVWLKTRDEGHHIISSDLRMTLSDWPQFFLRNSSVCSWDGSSAYH